MPIKRWCATLSHSSRTALAQLSHSSRTALAQLSHSRRGEFYDNAQAESLWSRLKTELLEARDWPVFTDLADAQASIATPASDI